MKIGVLSFVLTSLVALAILGESGPSAEAVHARAAIEGLWTHALTNRVTQISSEEEQKILQCVRTNLLAVVDHDEQDRLMNWVECQTLGRMVLRNEGMAELIYYRRSCAILDALAEVLWETKKDEARIFSLWDHQAQRCRDEAKRCKRETNVLTWERKRCEVASICLNFRLAMVPRSRLSDAELELLQGVDACDLGVQGRLLCLEHLKDAYARWDVGICGRKLADGNLFRRYQSRTPLACRPSPPVLALRETRSAESLLAHIDDLVLSAPTNRIVERHRYPFSDYTNHVDRILQQYREVESLICSVSKSEWTNLLQRVESRLALLTKERENVFQEFNCLICSHEISHALTNGWIKMTGDEAGGKEFMHRRKRCYGCALGRCLQKMDTIEKAEKQVQEALAEVGNVPKPLPYEKLSEGDRNLMDQLSLRRCELLRERWALSNLIKSYRYYSESETQ